MCVPVYPDSIKHGISPNLIIISKLSSIKTGALDQLSNPVKKEKPSNRQKITHRGFQYLRVDYMETEISFTRQDNIQNSNSKKI